MTKMIPKVGFVFSTKDRVDFTLRSLASIDTDSGFDLIWVDGSNTCEGKAVPESVTLRKARLLEIQYNVGGGPDSAIGFGLRRLLNLGYDYCGLIENDVLFQPGWFYKLMNLFEAADEYGFTVGAATVRNVESRVLLYRQQYTINWNVGAGMILFTRKAARVVLATYGPTTARKLAAFYRARFGIDLGNVWELWMDQEDRYLGCDWAYCMHLFSHGMISVGSIPSMASNIDCDMEKVLCTGFVKVSKGINKELRNDSFRFISRSFLSLVRVFCCSGFLPLRGLFTVLKAHNFPSQLLSLLRKLG
jgi:hypothetical protein